MEEGIAQASFHEWRIQLKLSKTDAAKALGRSWRQVFNYDVGAEKVPRIVRLAMTALTEHPELRATMPEKKPTQLDEDAFVGDPIFNPDIEKSYSPESQARMKAFREQVKAIADKAGEVKPRA